LSAYLEHDLRDAERAELDVHLVRCATCVSDLEDLRDAVDLLRRLPDPEPPPFLASRVMARIAAGEARPPVWRRWLEQLGAPLVAAPLAAAAAALAVFHFAAPPPGAEIVLASTQPEIVANPGEAQSRGTPAIVARQVGPVEAARLVVAPWRSGRRLLARDLSGASHPHSTTLARHFDEPVRAVAHQPH
jgi:anti-sigma factor RsiW